MTAYTAKASLIGLALVLALAWGGDAAKAGPLDEDTCLGIYKAHAALVKSGVRDDMDKGPEWVTANLPPARLQRIRRYIEMGEKLMFRCPNVVLTGPGATRNLPRRRPAIAVPAGGEAKPVAATTSTGVEANLPLRNPRGLRSGIAPDSG